MITNGEVGPLCGACREYLMQPDKDSKMTEILMDYDSLEVKRLGELCPSWWADVNLNCNVIFLKYNFYIKD